MENKKQFGNPLGLKVDFKFLYCIDRLQAIDVEIKDFWDVIKNQESYLGGIGRTDSEFDRREAREDMRTAERKIYDLETEKKSLKALEESWNLYKSKLRPYVLKAKADLVNKKRFTLQTSNISALKEKIIQLESSNESLKKSIKNTEVYLNDYTLSSSDKNEAREEISEYEKKINVNTEQIRKLLKEISTLADSCAAYGLNAGKQR